MEKFLELHESPDGLLKFGVTVADDGDITIGFFSDSPTPIFCGHTHGDILESILEVPMEQAVSSYVQSVLASEQVIVVIRIDGKITQVYVSDEPDSEGEWLIEGEELELRYWNGEPFSGMKHVDSSLV